MSSQWQGTHRKHGSSWHLQKGLISSRGVLRRTRRDAQASMLFTSPVGLTGVSSQTNSLELVG